MWVLLRLAAEDTTRIPWPCLPTSQPRPLVTMPVKVTMSTVTVQGKPIKSQDGNKHSRKCSLYILVVTTLFFLGFQQKHTFIHMLDTHSLHMSLVSVLSGLISKHPGHKTRPDSIF